MKANKTFLLGLVLAGMGVASAASIAPSRNVVFAEEEEKTVYDCTTDFYGAMSDVYDCVAMGGGWTIEAINLTEFFRAGQGGNLADDNGTLPLFTDFTDDFTDDALSLKTYPLFTNSGMWEDGVRYFNQYPTGWKMTNMEDFETEAAWPRGYCTNSTKYLKYYMDGHIHPGYGAGIISYFTVPRDGNVYLKDIITANAGSSDGMYLSIFHIPAAAATCNGTLWDSQPIHGLFGATPVYPSAGVNPAGDWSTGWTHIAPGETFELLTENIEVHTNDQIAFVLGAGPSNSNDYTATSPNVIYGESPIKQIDTSDDEVHDFATEFSDTFGKQEDGVCYGMEPWNVEVLNTAEFIKDGGGASLHDDNGKLATFQDWKNPDDYSLLSYPCWTNSSMVEEDGLHRYNQYPQGWRMTDQGDYASVDNCWPNDGSKCSASTAYLNTYADGRIHPGTGAGQVLYFKAPKTGTAYIADTLSVQSGGDGINVIVYHIPAAEVILQTWNSQWVHGLYNATPIFPEAGVNPVGYETGWFHVDSGATRKYVSDAFELTQGDILAFVYGCGANNACDMTETSPKVVYGTRPDVISLSKNSLSIAKDEEVQLKANVTPVGSSVKSVEWTSSNPEVATVTRGKVKGIGAGTATITATLRNGNLFPGDEAVVDTCEVTVVDGDMIYITNETLSVEQGLELQLSYEILPLASAGKEVTWSIVSGEDKIELSASGLVKGLLPGEATVRATISDTDTYAEKVITVTAAGDPVVTLSEQTAYVEVNEDTYIETSVSPVYHQDDEVSVSTGDPTIATATWSAGVITLHGVKAGVTTLSAWCEGGNATTINVLVQTPSNKSYQWSKEFSSSTSETWRYAMYHDGAFDERLVCASGAWGFSYETKKATQGLSYVPQTYQEGNQYFNIFGGSCVHPCPGFAAAVGLYCNVSGKVDYSSHFETASNGSSQQFKIMINDTQIYPTEGEWQVVDYNTPAQIVLTDVSVEAGDIIWTIVDSHTDGNSDYCYIDPIIRFTEYEAEPDCITLNNTELEMTVGDIEMLIPTITPAESEYKEQTWTSSDVNVAEVNDFGEVTAVGNGTCVITVTIEGGASASCTVTVTGGIETSSEAPVSSDPATSEAGTSEETPATSEAGTSEETPATSGCGGSILSASAIVCGIALAGLALVKSKKED